MEDRWNYILLAPEALVIPACVFAVAWRMGIAWLMVTVSVVFVVLLAFYRGRNWHRGLLRSPNIAAMDRSLVVSPCDGKVLRIQEHPETDTVQVAMFLNVHNVHVQYAPMAGRIVSIHHKPGEFQPAYLFEKSQYNERVETTLETDIGRVGIVQIAGLLARRILPFHKPGARLVRGEPLGLIKFGSRVDVHLPRARVQVLVKEGDRVRIGTPLAKTK